MEAKYIITCQAVKSILLIKGMLGELAIFRNLKTTLHWDNLSANKFVKNLKFYQKSKHIDVRHHFVNKKYKENKFILDRVSSQEQQAELLTKPLPNVVFDTQRKILNILQNLEINKIIDQEDCRFIILPLI